MAHAFDTGLVSAQRTNVRDSAVALLSGLLRPAGYLVAVIRTGTIVRGFTDSDGIGLLMAELHGRAPAIAIALGDGVSKPRGMGGFSYTKDVELIVYFLSNNLRSIMLGRHAIDVAGAASDAADPGLDVMMEHVEELIIGQRAGDNATVKEVRPEREEELMTESGFTLWAQRYTVQVNRSINAHRTVTEILREMRSKVRTSDQAMDVPTSPLLEQSSSFGLVASVTATLGDATLVATATVA